MMRYSLIFFACICWLSNSFAQTGFSIGVDSPDPQAAFEIQSTTQGVLISRMTTSQRDLIGPGVTDEGLLIYNTSTSEFNYWDGVMWIAFPGSGVGGANTLDQAYDEGGAGSGRVIIADNGALEISGEDGVISTGTSGSGATAPNTDGNKFLWNPRKGAFRVGGSFASQWHDASIGEYSTALGLNTTGSGDYSFAGGLNSEATGLSSIAYGSGNSIQAAGSYSSTFGRNNTISATNSFAGGESHNLAANYCFAGGFSMIIFGSNSTGFGASNTISGAYSLAVGQSNTVFQNHGFAQGQQCSARGLATRAMGSFLEANAYGETIVGLYSSNAPGTAASWVGTDRIFTVGNGSSTGARSDAFFVLKNGDATLQGTLTQASDERLKKEIKPLNNSLNNLLKLNGYSYYWKDKHRSNNLQFGVIAQEIESVFPNLVHTFSSEDDTKSVDYTSLTPVIIEAIKEQQSQIELLEKQNAELMERLKRVESYIDNE